MEKRYPKARYGRPLLLNLKALFETNEEEFLAWANRDADDVPQPGLTAYAGYFTARRIQSIFPTLTLVLRRSKMEEDADGAAIKQDHVIEVIIECAGEDPELIAEDSFKRAAAVDQLVRSATEDQLYQGYAINQIKRPSFEVTPWDFTELLNRVTSHYHRRATLTISFFDLWEKR